MILITVLEWAAFGGSMLCSILYGNGGRAGPLSGVIVAILFIAFGITAGIYAAAVSNVFFLAIHLRNLRKTHMEDPNTIKKQTVKDVQRLVDLCHGAAIAEKMAYNASRQDHKIENRTGPGGKKY